VAPEVGKDPATTPVFGPLSAVLRETEDLRSEGNPAAQHMTKMVDTLILEFAGHDATGHTLAFLAFELARNPPAQARLQEGVDAFWKKGTSEGNADSMSHDDLHELQFLTRCVTETMRTWGVVPQGTFRVLNHADVVHAGDKRAKVSKGTFIQILNWTRHRNPDLWGDDVNDWNPDRVFSDVELWGNKGFSAHNPRS
jgi:cytochrome P450